MCESENTQPAPLETTEAPQEAPHESPQYGRELAAKPNPNQKPNEPKEPNKNQVIAGSVNPS